MFELKFIDPKYYRKQTRNAIFIMIGIFIVLGLSMARLSLTFLANYSDNPFILNMIGAVAGLILTFFIVKTFFINSEWMQPSMYAWRLKRTLMKINNKLRPLKEAEAQNNEEALKLLRYYHLGLKQMNELEDNSHALIDMIAEMNELEAKLAERGIPLEQTQFDETRLAQFK